jgi:hypothetical protein
MKAPTTRHTLREAFQYMRDLITAGAEFPAAHERAVLRYDLNAVQARALLILYDTRNSERSSI